MFIPVGNLVNGATIAQVEMDEVTYWHVELDSHDILLANNLPAESYLAMGNRGFFEERRGLLPAILGGVQADPRRLLPPGRHRGPVLDFVRQRLVARAEEMGWKRSRDADLHLMVDGEIVRPRVEGNLATFEFPTSAKDVRLMSNTFSPVAFGSGDQRMLGVMLGDEIAFGDRKVLLDDERLRDGIHQLEDHGGNLRRWTNGELVLDPQFWDGLSGAVTLRVIYDAITIRGWVAPMKAQTEFPSDKSARPQLHVA